MTNNTNYNFFESVIDLKNGDALFFDTNVLMDYLIPTNKYHLAVSHFLAHTITFNCQRLISATVLQELTHVLARVLYVDYASSEGINIAWGNLTKQRNPITRNLVQHFNEIAITKINEILPLFTIVNTDETIANQALALLSNYNLLSGDAFIASQAISYGVPLVTLDSDLCVIETLTIYFARNDDRSKTFNPSIYDNVEEHASNID